MGAKIYAGFIVEAWIFDWKNEAVLVEYTFPAAMAAMGLKDIGTGYLIESAENKSAGWRPMDRRWREAGGEVFLLAPAKGAQGLSMHEESSSALDLFRQMGTASSPGAIYAPKAVPGGRAKRLPS